MTEIVLFLTIVALCALLGYERYEGRKERLKMIQAIMSKTAQDLVNFEMADKVEKIIPPDPTAGLVPEAEMTDAEFEKYVINDGRPQD